MSTKSSSITDIFLRVSVFFYLIFDYEYLQILRMRTPKVLNQIICRLMCFVTCTVEPNFFDKQRLQNSLTPRAEALKMKNFNM